MALPVNGSTHLIPPYYSFYRPRKDERLSWPSWLTCSGWLTHISGHPSAAGRAQYRESSTARDRRSTTVPRHQLTREYVVTTLTNSRYASLDYESFLQTAKRHSCQRDRLNKSESYSLTSEDRSDQKIILYEVQN